MSSRVKEPHVVAARRRMALRRKAKREELDRLADQALADLRGIVDWVDFESIPELMARLDKCLALTSNIASAYEEFLVGDFLVMGRKTTSAMVVSEFMVDYYTCLETCFLRISQFFENHLSKDRWHSDLLEKMALKIEGVRDPVISDSTAAGLGELMKFRHFRRYYFELDYDWDKLDYLQKVFARVLLAIPAELNAFKDFLRLLQDEV
ncbi:MAG TPA: hypothetical protein PKE55_03400 [Kiritimatiellia bacterium]|nr:hypothetical protein [Kiritimatiellia bacterium]